MSRRHRSRSRYEPVYTPPPPLPEQPSTQAGAVMLLLLLLAFVAAGPAALFLLDVPLIHLHRYILGPLCLVLGLGCLLKLAIRFLRTQRSYFGYYTEEVFHPTFYFNRERRRWARLLGFVVALSSAAAVWLFVPALDGTNLWMAWQQADREAARLQSLAPQSAPGFAQGQSERNALMQNYPLLRLRLRPAENSWKARRTEAIAALTVRVNAARGQAQALAVQEKYREAAQLAQRAFEELQGEAQALGQWEEVNKFRHAYLLFAEVAAKAGKQAPP